MALSELASRCTRLERELAATRKELARARSALQKRKVDKSPSLSTNAAVDALSAVLRHQLPQALLEARSEAAARTAALERHLAQEETRAFVAETSAQGFRHEVWNVAQAGLRGWISQEEALHDLCHLVESEEGG
jgi:septal ring factor EnvC (AmiA/AmiB activator)